jgi:hypothetical protein
MRQRIINASLALSTLLTVAPLAAQIKAPSANPLPASLATHSNWPAAAPADVDTVDHLMSALYLAQSCGCKTTTANGRPCWKVYRLQH